MIALNVLKYQCPPTITHVKRNLLLTQHNLNNRKQPSKPECTNVQPFKGQSNGMHEEECFMLLWLNTFTKTSTLI